MVRRKQAHKLSRNPLFPRWGNWVENRGRLAAYVILTTPLATTVGLLTGMIFLPVVQTLFIFPVFAGLVTRKHLAKACVTMMGWAVVVALTVATLTFHLGETVGERVLLGEHYRLEMFTWIRTGVGPEGDIFQFAPQHLSHLIIFCIATAVSGGLLGLVMGSALMNYMSYYLGSLLAKTDQLLPVAVMGWPVWAGLRVAGFILLATAISSLFYQRAGIPSGSFQTVKKLILVGGLLVLLDVVLKWLFAPFWQTTLLSLTHIGV
jgi:hypothetical protein